MSKPIGSGVLLGSGWRLIILADIVCDSTPATGRTAPLNLCNSTVASMKIWSGLPYSGPYSDQNPGPLVAAELESIRKTPGSGL